MTIIVFDTETTGLLQARAADINVQPYLIEFHGIKLDFSFNVIQTLSFRCRPPIQIPDDAIKIHGITNEMMINERPFPSYFVSLAQFFLGCSLEVGHNCFFDKMILWYELIRIGKEMNFPYPPISICTAETSSKQLGYRQNLSDLHLRLFGTDFTGSHSAASDCEATMKCFVELVRKGIIEL